MKCWYSANGSICSTAAEISWCALTISSVSRLLISQYSSRMLLLRAHTHAHVTHTHAPHTSRRGTRSRDSQRERHVLLHPLQGVQQRRGGVAPVLLLLRAGAAHRQHVLVVEVVELRRCFVVALAGALRLPSCDWTIGCQQFFGAEIPKVWCGLSWGAREGRNGGLIIIVHIKYNL